MTLQILALAIYNRTGERREICFRPGKVNIVTGASKTGKLALIHIVDYCLGRNDFTVPAGVIREAVVWYVLHVKLPDTEVVIGRPAPEGSRSTSAVYLEVGSSLGLPDFSALKQNSNTEALARYLTEAVGITANENMPPEGQSRQPLQANIKHARFLLYQPQSRIADPNMLFYRQEEQHTFQTIKDTLPYFLGATGDDQYDRLQQLRRAKRELRLLERRLSEEQALRGRDNSRAAALVAEARNVGLLIADVVVDSSEGEIDALRTLLDWTPNAADYEPGDILRDLQAARDALLTESRTLQSEIAAARSFSEAQEGFNTEAVDQRNRLSAIHLYRQEPDANRCPLCENELVGSVPKAQAIQENLVRLEHQLRRCAKITSATWMMTMGPNGVVPIRQDRARLEPGPSLVCRPHLPPCGVLLRIQDRPAMESCGRPRPAYVLEHFLVADQWLSGPVAADQAEHPVVDRVPLARSGWVVGHRYHQVKLVRQLLQGDFPFPLAVVVSPASVCLDQQALRPCITLAPSHEPPAADTRHGECWCLVRRPHDHQPSVVRRVIDPIRDGLSHRITGEIVREDYLRFPPPGLAGVLVGANQLLLLGVDANHRQATTYVKPAQASEVAELSVPVWISNLGQLLAVGPQGEAGVMQQPRDGVGGHLDPPAAQGLGQFPHRAVRPQQAGDRIASRGIVEQTVQGPQHPGTEASIGWRPAPAWRMRPGASRSWPRSSRSPAQWCCDPSR